MDLPDGRLWTEPARLSRGMFVINIVKGHARQTEDIAFNYLTYLFQKGLRGSVVTSGLRLSSPGPLGALFRVGLTINAR